MAADDLVNSRLFEEKVATVRTGEGGAKGPIGATVAAIGKSFLGLEYRAGSLDDVDDERLQIDLAGVDCVTLVEYSLALARVVREGSPNYPRFAQEVGR